MQNQLDPMIVDELKRITSLLSGAQELFVSLNETENPYYSERAKNLNRNALFILKTAVDNLHELSDTLYFAFDEKGSAHFSEYN